MNKKTLIILVALALLSFGGSFLASLFLGGGGQKTTPEDAADRDAPKNVLANLGGGSPDALRPNELQLENLIKEFRQKRSEQDALARRLDKREQRLQMAEEQLRKQAQELEDLRIRLVAPLTGLREAQAKLERTRVLIRREEQANLKKNAQTISAMSGEATAKMFARMIESGQAEDVARTLRYMSARAAGKVLAAMPDKAQAAGLVDLMKRIREED